MPDRLAPDFGFFHQGVFVLVQIGRGHVGVIEIRTHEASALIPGSNAFGFAQRRQVEPLIIVFSGSIVIKGQKTGVFNIRRREEKHQAQTVIAFFHAEGLDVSHPFSAFFIDQDHFHFGSRTVPGFPLIDTVHDFTAGKSQCCFWGPVEQYHDCSDDRQQQ